MFLINIHWQFEHTNLYIYGESNQGNSAANNLATSASVAPFSYANSIRGFHDYKEEEKQSCPTHITQWQQW